MTELLKDIIKHEKEHIENPNYKLIKEKNGNVIKGCFFINKETEDIELHCHSTDRQKKEESMKTSFQKHFEERLQKIAFSKRKKRYSKVLEMVGRLKQKYSKISPYYEIKIEADKDKKYLTKISWKFKKEKAQENFQGKYILRANRVNLSEKELWETYIMLTEVEDSFRSLKSELGLRPIYHQKEKRIDAHLFLTILSYHVMHVIRHKLRTQDLRYSWSTIRANMRTQIRVSTSMKTKNGKTIHIRKTTTPEPFHQKIYNALNISPFNITAKTIV